MRIEWFGTRRAYLTKLRIIAAWWSGSSRSFWCCGWCVLW